MPTTTRKEWRTSAEPVLQSLCQTNGWNAIWNDRTHAVQINSGSRANGCYVELNRLRVFLFAAINKLGEAANQLEIKDDVRQEFGGTSVRARVFGGVEDCYFQGAGIFAIIPGEELPTDQQGLQEVVEAALDGNDWLAQQIKALPKCTAASGDPGKRRTPPAPLDDKDFLTVVLVIRAIENGQLPERSQRSILSRVCHIADLVPATRQSVARRALQPGEPFWKEHAVPCDFLVEKIRNLITDSNAPDQNLANLLKRHLVVVEITRAERRRLDCVSGLKTRMPEDWPIATGDTLARFNAAGIALDPEPL